MNWLGDIRLGDTIDFKFTTTAAATGAPTTLAGTPVISAYVGNSVTQITAGITLTVDFDAVTGLHNVRVVASGANGFATASNYQLVITTGTVGGTSAVGYVVGQFSIEARSAVMPTTAARTLDVTATGAAGIDLANVENQASTLGLSGTTIGIVTTATTATNVTNVNGLAANVITAASINAAAMNGKGDWNIGKTGYALSAAAVQAIWDAATTALTVVGSIGKLIVDNLNAAISTRATPTNITAASGIVLSGVTHTGAVIPTVTTLTGHTAQTGDNFARLGAPAGVSVSADVAAVKVDTAAVKAKTDSLAFTVAGQVDANIQSINDVTILGNGGVTPFNV